MNVHVDLVCKASSEGDKHVKHVQYCYDESKMWCTFSHCLSVNGSL